MESMAAGMGNLSKLVEVQSIRKVWPKENDFSDWLATDYLNELGILLGLDNIELIERESPVSKFKADIVAQGLDANGQEICIVIENQLEQTNHDHLGKLITYAAGKNAL